MSEPLPIEGAHDDPVPRAMQPLMVGDLAGIVRRLEKRHPEASLEEITAITAEIYESYSQSRIRNYIPMLVERAARDRLRHHPDSDR